MDLVSGPFCETTPNERHIYLQNSLQVRNPRICPASLCRLLQPETWSASTQAYTVLSSYNGQDKSRHKKPASGTVLLVTLNFKWLFSLDPEKSTLWVRWSLRLISEQLSQKLILKFSPAVSLLFFPPGYRVFTLSECKQTRWVQRRWNPV
jgi:hypothetical protein